MKKIIEFFKNLFKSDKMPKEKTKAEKEKDKISCNWNIKEFRKEKRGVEIAEAPGGRGKKPKPGTGGGGTITPTNGGTVWLEFYGAVISGTMWNVYGDFTVGHSGFSAEEIAYVTSRIAADYAPFNVTITTDKAVFDATPAGKRIRIIFTEDWEWYCGTTPCAGGVAYINSFKWTSSESPGFVFTSALGYSTHRSGEAGSHEVGHTAGLRHQVLCSGDVIINQYNPGDGVTAPTMGNSYNVSSGDWWIGPNTTGCSSVQKDAEILASVFGLK